MERLFPLVHPLINESQIVNDLFLHRVHRQNLSGRVFQLLRCQVKHAELAVAAAEQVHRFQTRIWILPRSLQLRYGFVEVPRADQVRAQLEAKLEIGRIPLQLLARIVDQNF